MMIRDLSSNFSTQRPQSAGRPDAAPAAPSDTAQLSGARPEASINLASVLAATAAEANSLAGKLPEHVEGEVLVKLKPGMDLQGMEDFASTYGGQLIEKIAMPDNMYKSFGGDLLHIKLPAGMSTAEAMAAMGKDDRVAYAASNDIMHRMEGTNVPNDLDPRLWGLNNTGQDGGTSNVDIDAPEAWNVSTGAKAANGGPVIAVIDTGLDYTHNDLKNNSWVNPGEIPGDGIDNDGNGVIDDVHGFNAINDSGDPMDDHGHGSHCSGTIGGEGNNGDGVVGVNWNASIMGVKFLSASGGGTLADAVKAISYATANGARITSNSWGGGGYNQALKDALAASPALHIFAAGNESNDNDASPAYPGSYDLPNIVSVAAVDRNGNIADFSNFGATAVDLGAPGVDIYSSLPGNQYDSWSGTSMATPHVSGVAGLIATVYPDASNEQIKSRLMNGARPLDSLAGKTVSGGMLNAANSLENDSTAPAAPNDLRGTNATSRSIDLSWTATADDGWCGGSAAGYKLVYSDRPIVDGEANQGEVSFDQAQRVVTGAPGAVGNIESASIGVMPSGQERTLYVGLKVYDNVGNLSEMRTAQVSVPAASVAFEDNKDAGNFTAEGAWAQSEVEGRGLVWTDSPNGEYGNNENRSLTSKPIDLSAVANPTMMFDAKFDLERRYDFVQIEVSEVPAEPPTPPTPPEDGQPPEGADERQWTEVAKFNGTSDWATQSIDLSAFDGKNVQVRFRITSDGSVTKDGFSMDKLVVVGDPRPAPPAPEPPAPPAPEPPTR